MNQSTSINRGSVYLVTVITVAAISSMVLIGVKLRTATNTTQAIITEMTESNVSLLDATEFALQTIASDPIWPSTAQSGTIFPSITPFAKEDAVYTGTVLDANTNSLPTSTTTTYRLNISATNNEIKSAAQIELLAEKPDYQATLDDLSAIFYWPLDEENNPHQALEYIESQHGTYLAPAVAAADINNQGAPVPLFNDSNDHIEIPWVSSFKQENGSITLWMKCTGNVRSNNYSFLGMDTTLNGVPTLNMSVYFNAIVAYIDDDNSWGFGNFTRTPFDLITPGTWYHIALVWGDNGLHIYVDGTLQGSNVSNTDGINTQSAKNGGEQPLRVGGGFYTGFPSTPTDGFEGSVAHVAFFEDPLSAVEVAELAAIRPDLRTYSLVNNSWVQVFE
ncbi:MAG: LamG domain-containing protein [Phycisphaerales bacterium]|nr:LamG domain-containing protein [Phycisphaerales bacterium]